VFKCWTTSGAVCDLSAQMFPLQMNHTVLIVWNKLTKFKFKSRRENETDTYFVNW